MAKPHIVIIEGPDGVGKSTLIASLLRLMPEAEHIATKRQPGKPRPKQADFHKMLLQLPIGKLYLLDRHDQSNIAYECMRGNPVPSDALARLCELAERCNVLSIYLLPQEGAAYEDELIKLNQQQFALLINLYKQLLNSKLLAAAGMTSVLATPKPDASHIANLIRNWYA